MLIPAPDITITFLYWNLASPAAMSLIVRGPPFPLLSATLSKALLGVCMWGGKLTPATFLLRHTFNVEPLKVDLSSLSELFSKPVDMATLSLVAKRWEQFEPVRFDGVLVDDFTPNVAERFLCIRSPFTWLFGGLCAVSVFADTAAVEKLFVTAVDVFLIFRELFGESVSTRARLECDEGLLMETVNDL